MCGPRPLVYALGQLGYDFGTEARRDSIMQHMGPSANPYDPIQLTKYLEANPWDGASVIWTLNLDATPIYSILPGGPFGGAICAKLCSFLAQQTHEGIERISIPGSIAGKATLLSGQVVPAILPELRGMYSWTTSALVHAVSGSPPPESGSAESVAYAHKTSAIRDFLHRVYYGLRNLGTTPQQRAINYAATNALGVAGIYEDALKEQMELDTIEVERSPICRPDSDCWDVKLLFFFPQRELQTVRKVYRYTVDVSDVVPVAIGSVRAWFVR
jgi:cyanobactin maturation PatA/PatG family protease